MSVQELPAFIGNERLNVLLVYCAAHRLIVRLVDAEQTEEGRYVCRACLAAGHIPTDRKAR